MAIFLVFLIFASGMINFPQGTYADCQCHKLRDCPQLKCPTFAFPVCMLCQCTCFGREAWRKQMTLGTNKATNADVGKTQQHLQVKS
ncbi:hypothetical protein Ccrd_015330 [Cynara cardunculus var. scolymus]|uniref:CRC domain-containing protein n=1 Tax=Cynara cardunculus var. scolymus TaxID=59895 RepID=A0A103YC20_CYNCS|nr:hypothetical protein Ccrd_015330 [Cynara cardunculus var. scolymus]